MAAPVSPSSPSSSNTMQVIVGVTLGLALLAVIVGGLILAAQKLDTPVWLIAIPPSVITGFLGWLAPSPSLRGTSQLNTNDVTDLLKTAVATPAPAPVVMTAAPPTMTFTQAPQTQVGHTDMAPDPAAVAAGIDHDAASGFRRA